MPILAALPAIAAVGSLASGAVGTGMAIDNASKAGSNPGTAPIDPSQVQMDQGAFGYGGGIQSQGQQALQGQYRQAQGEQQQAQQNFQQLNQAIQAGQAALGKHPAFRSEEDKRAIQQMMVAQTSLPGATERLQKAGVAWKDAQQKMADAPNLAQTEANRYQGLAQAADNRQGVQMNLDNYNQARGQSQSALGLTQAAAEGNAPSVAAMQMRQGLDQANNQAAGLAASARGGGGNLAFAARAAQQQQGQNAMQTVQNAAMLRANEMMQARGQYLQGANNVQQMDLSQSGQQATLDAQQRQLNDQRNQAYETGLQRIYGAQQQGGQAYQTGQTANNMGLQKANHGYADARTSDQQAATSGALQMGGRALEGLGRIPGAFDTGGSSSPAAGNHGAYGGGSWVKQADGNYGYQNNG